MRLHGSETHTTATIAGTTRRDVLKLGISGSALLVSGCYWGNGTAYSDFTEITPLLAIDRSGAASIFTPQAEMGQDVFTSLAKILADEIGLDFDRVKIKHAHHGKVFYGAMFGEQSTGGSRSVRQWYAPLRAMGARVRSAFVTAASSRLNIPPSTLILRNSRLIDASGKELFGMGELVEDVLRAGLPKEAPLRDWSNLSLIGHNTPRKDTLPKIIGQAEYGADVRLPGQIYAAVQMLPHGSGQATANGRTKVEALPGILGVERLENAIAVVADKWWLANKAVKQLVVPPGELPANSFDSARMDRSLNLALRFGAGKTIVEQGDFSPLENVEFRQVSNTYAVPFLAHVCMEPMVATADIRADRAHLRIPTQAPDRVAKYISEKFSLPIDKVLVENTFLGGGFGRKGFDFEAMKQAAILSHKYHRPTQVIWDRETDTQHDQFRPAARFSLSAALDKRGNIAAYDFACAAPSVGKQRFPSLFESMGHEFNEHPFLYDAKARRHRWIDVELPVSLGYWRAVADSHIPFAAESFADELAHAANRDPLEFRLDNLSDRPHVRNVLYAVAEISRWAEKRPDGRAIGLAVGEAWGSACAQVAEISIDNEGLKVHQLWAAVDCGLVISPESVRAQMQSGMIYALTAALRGKIDFANGKPVQSNFHDLHILQMGDIPKIEIKILNSQRPPGGVGELGVPSCAPAIANAIHSAIGRRITDLPLESHFSNVSR